MISPEEYIEQRLSDQIGWYDRKSGTNQRWFRWLRIVEIIAAASIPLLVGYADSITEFKVVVGILGLLIAVMPVSSGFINSKKTGTDTERHVKH